MDHTVNDHTNRMNEVDTGLAEQLGIFFRRNVSWFLAAGLALLLLQDVFGTHGVLAMRRTQQEASAVRHEIDQMNEENRRLEDRVKELKTDPKAIERIAREEMGLARPGEYIFKIAPKGAESSAPSSQPEDTTSKP
jgi:cell division protein FtsB